MAKMIPARIDSAAPASERRVFDLLRADPDTKDWTVLHSLGLASRGRKPYGEIDFLVMVPRLGIMCLEIKGGRVRCEDGVWYTRNKDDHESKLNKSPIMQVRDGMFAVLKAIKGRFGDTSSEARVVVGSAVVFPDVTAPPSGIEAEPCEFIDRPAMTTRPISVSIELALRKHREKLGSREMAEPATLNTIRAFLRPDFDLVISRSTVIGRAEEQLLRLAEDQFDVLDSIESNHRCIVDGAAGTGKTLIAVELAKRSIAKGKRPVVLCYNRLLGGWLAEQIGSGATVGSYHRIVRRIIQETSINGAFLENASAGRDAPDFEDWALYALEALGERGSIGDLLIVDEAQDLAADGEIAVLDAMLAGGLAGGSWVLLGDFARQAIYGGTCAYTGLEGFEDLIGDRCRYLTKLHLKANYRNTRQIAEETAMLSGFDAMPYRLNSTEGPPVDFRYWSEESEQEQELTGILDDLRREGLKPEDITILSPKRFEHSVASRTPSNPNSIFDVTSGEAPAGVVRFATIHAFKGLETSVAVLTDLRGIEEATRQALLYVGMSRARTGLFMLVHKSFKPHVDRSFRRRIEKAS